VALVYKLLRNVIADFVNPPQALGHGYRVEARIVA
jgi:hypothetical protein